MLALVLAAGTQALPAPLAATAVCVCLMLACPAAVFPGLQAAATPPAAPWLWWLPPPRPPTPPTSRTRPSSRPCTSARARAVASPLPTLAWWVGAGRRACQGATQASAAHSRARPPCQRSQHALSAWPHRAARAATPRSCCRSYFDIPADPGPLWLPLRLPAYPPAGPQHRPQARRSHHGKPPERRQEQAEAEGAGVQAAQPGLARQALPSQQQLPAQPAWRRARPLWPRSHGKPCGCTVVLTLPVGSRRLPPWQAEKQKAERRGQRSRQGLDEEMEDSARLEPEQHSQQMQVGGCRRAHPLRQAASCTLACCPGDLAAPAAGCLGFCMLGGKAVMLLWPASRRPALIHHLKACMSDLQHPPQHWHRMWRASCCRSTCAPPAPDVAPLPRPSTALALLHKRRSGCGVQHYPRIVNTRLLQPLEHLEIKEEPR